MRGLAVGGKRLARERSSGLEDNNRQNQIASKRPKVSILRHSKVILQQHLQESTNDDLSKGKETKKSDKIDCVDDGGQLNEGRKNASNNLEEAKQESEDKSQTGANNPRRIVKVAPRQRSFQANLFGNLFFKHLQKAKSSLDQEKDQVSFSTYLSHLRFEIDSAARESCKSCRRQVARVKL